LIRGYFIDEKGGKHNKEFWQIKDLELLKKKARLLQK